MKGDQSLIANITQQIVSYIKKVKEELLWRFPRLGHDTKPKYHHKIPSSKMKLWGATFRWFITANLKTEKGMCIPNLLKRHLYRGTRQPLKEMHTLSSGPIGRISQSGGLLTVKILEHLLEIRIISNKWLTSSLPHHKYLESLSLFYFWNQFSFSFFRISMNFLMWGTFSIYLFRSFFLGIFLKIYS